MGFEPTERVQAAQTISSRSRYDPFDTPPYSVFDVLSEKGENYTRELVIFRKRALRFLPVTTGIFSGQPSSKAMAFRVSHLRPLGQLSVYLKCNPCSGRMQEKHARTIWNCEIQTRAKPCVADIFSGRNGRSFQKFRVSPVMTTSIPLHVGSAKCARRIIQHDEGNCKC